LIRHRSKTHNPYLTLGCGKQLARATDGELIDRLHLRKQDQSPCFSIFEGTMLLATEKKKNLLLWIYLINRTI
jgi:hypothetical protein